MIAILQEVQVVAQLPSRYLLAGGELICFVSVRSFARRSLGSRRSIDGGDRIRRHSIGHHDGRLEHSHLMEHVDGDSLQASATS